MKKINRSPTTDINFDKNASYNDNFADWLTEMVDHWAKNYTSCTFEIIQVGTEGTQVEIESKPKQNINFDCSESLNTDLKKVNKITYTKKASTLKTSYVVTWKTELKPKTTGIEKSKEVPKNDNVEEPKKVPKSLKSIVEPLAKQIYSPFKFENTKTNKKLTEEIDRIKQLIK
jgi:hypothetical protein